MQTEKINFFKTSWDEAKELADRIIEYGDKVSKIAIFYAILSFILGASDRAQERHYQAWQLINSAVGEAGDGGRSQAVSDLAADGVNLSNIDLSGATLEYVSPKASGTEFLDDQINFSGAQMRYANLTDADLNDVNLGCRRELPFAQISSSNGCPLSYISRPTDLTNAVLVGATVKNSDFEYAIMTNTEFGVTKVNNQDTGLYEQTIDSSNFSNANMVLKISNNGAPAGTEWAVTFTQCDFDAATLTSDFTHISFIGKNSFVGATVEGEDFDKALSNEWKRVDLSNAIISGNNMKHKPYTEGDFPRNVAKLCHTRLNKILSVRDCAAG